MQVGLIKLSSRVLVLGAIGTLTGCGIVPKPFGYVQVWSDRNTYGDPSMFLERVRTDSPLRFASSSWTTPSGAIVPTSPEQRQGSRPAAEPVADAATSLGTWLFH